MLDILPGDKEVTRAKVVCLLHDKKYDEAMELCKDVPELALEKAYALYRGNKVCVRL